MYRWDGVHTGNRAECNKYRDSEMFSIYRGSPRFVTGYRSTLDRAFVRWVHTRVDGS